MDETLYAKRFNLTEKYVAVWDEFPVMGDFEECEALIKTHGPFTSEEQAIGERERLKQLRQNKMKEDRWRFRREWGVEGLTLSSRSVIPPYDLQKYSPTDFYIEYSIEPNFEPIK